MSALLGISIFLQTTEHTHMHLTKYGFSAVALATSLVNQERLYHQKYNYLCFVFHYNDVIIRNRSSCEDQIQKCKRMCATFFGTDTICRRNGNPLGRNRHYTSVAN